MLLAVGDHQLLRMAVKKASCNSYRIVEEKVIDHINSYETRITIILLHI